MRTPGASQPAVSEIITPMIKSTSRWNTILISKNDKNEYSLEARSDTPLDPYYFRCCV